MSFVRRGGWTTPPPAPVTPAKRLRFGALAGLLLVASLAVVGLGSTVPAAAAPPGPEFPTSWTKSGNTATGTTASGVVVTMTVSGPAQLRTTNDLDGDVVISGNRPSYLPTLASGTKSALWVTSLGCRATTSNGCGTITYTFSQPVKNPTLYVGDVGAGMYYPGQNFSEFYDHPLTVQGGSTGLPRVWLTPDV